MSDTSSSRDEGSDTVVETSSSNIVTRAGGSLAGAAFGVLLLLGAVGVLFWNEGRAVSAARGLGQAARVLVEATPGRVDPAQDRHLVHLAGPLATHGALSDPEMMLTKDDLVHLKRRVEMFQWKEDKETRTTSQLGGGQTTQTTYTYRKEWSDTAVDSSRFKNNHRNPEMPLAGRVFTAEVVTMGERTLAPKLLDGLENYQPLDPPATAPDGYRREGRELYRGADPQRPEVGDLRVTFSGVPAQAVSVLAEQRGPTLQPFRTDSGYRVGLIVPGDVDADQMLADKGSQENLLTWLLRLGGFVAVVIGLALLASPLAVLADVLPFLGSIVQGGIFFVAVLLGIPVTLLTIGVAWIAARPLVGGGLVGAAVLGVAAFVALRRRRRARFLPGGTLSRA